MDGEGVLNLSKGKCLSTYACGTRKPSVLCRENWEGTVFSISIEHSHVSQQILRRVSVKFLTRCSNNSVPLDFYPLFKLTQFVYIQALTLFHLLMFPWVKGCFNWAEHTFFGKSNQGWKSCITHSNTGAIEPWFGLRETLQVDSLIFHGCLLLFRE